MLKKPHIFDIFSLSIGRYLHSQRQRNIAFHVHVAATLIYFHLKKNKATQSEIMQAFHPLSVRRFQQKAQVVTPDTVYWERLGVSLQ